MMWCDTPEPGPAAESDQISTADQLRRVRDLGQQCTGCELHKTRTQVVVYRGTAVDHCKVLLVGEAPGFHEDQLGIPFVGRSGKLLDEQLLSSPKLDPWGLVNLVLCRPADNLLMEHQVRACEGFLLRKIMALRPEWIVALGRKPERALSIQFRLHDGRITLPYGEVGFYSVMHPSAVLHGTPRATWDAQWEKLRERIK